MSNEHLREAAEEAGITYEGIVQTDTAVPDPDVEHDELGNLSIVWDDGSGRIIQGQINKLTMQKDGMYSYFSARSSTDKGKNWSWILEPGRINWYSMTSKTALRRELDGRLKLDWKQRLAQIVVICAQRIKASSQAVDLAEVTFDEDIRWVCPPLIEAGEHTVLFAPGGVGKSLLSLGVCVQTATGERVIPGTDPPAQPVNVLYLDWETNKQTHARRMASIAKGAGLVVPKGRVFYWRMEFALEESLEDLRAFIKLNHIGLVIIDSAGVAANGDINTTEIGTQYIKTIRSLGDVAVLTITHMSWEQMEKGRGKTLRPIGSVYFQNGPRSSWGLIGEQDETGEKVKHLGLVHVKSNNDMLKNPIGFQADFSDKTSIKWTSESVHTSQQVAQHVSIVKRIEELLVHGRWTLDSIVEELPDVKKDTIARTLKRLVKARYAIQQGEEYVAAVRSVGHPDKPVDESAQYDMTGALIEAPKTLSADAVGQGEAESDPSGHPKDNSPLGELSSDSIKDKVTNTGVNTPARGPDNSRTTRETSPDKPSDKARTSSDKIPETPKLNSKKRSDNTPDKSGQPESVRKITDAIESKKADANARSGKSETLDWDSGKVTETNE